MANTKPKIATKQARPSPISNVAPPPNRQFGAPEGNPRHNGVWKKVQTSRYWIEVFGEMSLIEKVQWVEKETGQKFPYDLASVDFATIFTWLTGTATMHLNSWQCDGLSRVLKAPRDIKVSEANLDRIEGKPLQRVEAQVEGELPISLLGGDSTKSKKKG